jgi:tRNA-Thr(GGU) m(6)t(6)A37 methyltransferase TsaA
VKPIAFIESPFKQKFGLPRQPGLIDSAEAYVRFVEPFNTPQAFRGIEEFSHLWLQFEFHENKRETFQPLVRPPRLGGNTKVGVFASRSSFRPNALGLSLVRLQQLVIADGKASLRISCPDLLDGTPIFDVKPYIPYSDCVSDAKASYAATVPEPMLRVEFSDVAIKSLQNYLLARPEVQLEQLIHDVIALDPRPAYKGTKQDQKEYFLRLYDYDIAWRVNDTVATVVQIKDISKL